MAVTIGHGYAPVLTPKSVEYEYGVTLDDEYTTQLGAPAYYDGIMRFDGGDICFDRSDVDYSLTESIFTDTSNNVLRYWSEFDPNYNMYIMQYTVNNGTPTIIDSSTYPIHFGWYAANGGYWNDGVMPGFRAYINGRTVWGREFGGGEVRVETRVSLTLTNRTYEVTETVTRT